MTRFAIPESRPLALFRIVLGAVLLHEGWQHARSLGTFYADGGLFPRALESSGTSFGAFSLVGSNVGVAMVFALGIGATLCFTLGLFTRCSTALTWLFFVSLEHRAPLIHNGGDRIVAVALFLAFFTDVGARYSLDALRAGRRPARGVGVAPLLLAAFPAVVYVETAIEKLRSSPSGWLDGSVLFADLHLHGWARPGGVWLGAHRELSTWFGVGTLAVELGVPALLLLPPQKYPLARPTAIAGHVGLQLGILATLKVGIFTEAMLAMTPLWLAPEWLDVAEKKLRRAFAPRDSSAPLAHMTRGSIGLAALFVCIAATPYTETLGRVLRVVGLDLNVALFTVAYPSVRWEAVGTTDDGETTDPLPSDADFSDRVTNSLWMQLPYRLARYERLGAFLCERPAPDGARLHRVQITRYERAPLVSEPPGRESAEVVLDRACP